MGVLERKEREKGEMKKLILAAALKMFLTEGYAKTSIRNIAESIEYSPGTIYLYYKDKDELLYDVQHQAYDTLLDVFKKNAAAKNPLKRLEQICKIYINFGLENPELYDLMFIIRAPMNVDENVHKANGGDCLGFLKECLKECMDKGLIKQTNVELATLSIWSMAHGLVSLKLRCRLKVMFPESDEVSDMLNLAMVEYLDQIKT